MADLDPELDPELGQDELLLSALPLEDRAAVERWSDRLGLGRAGWARVSSFRCIIEILAILTAMDRLREEKPGLSDSAAFYEAAEGLGFDDDPARKTHPAETPARRLRDWLKRAWGESGGNLRSRKSA
jgi:hypothetical protein